MTLGLAVLWLATQLSVFAHLAFVPHVTCLEHGELVDAGAQLAVAEAVERDVVAAQSAQLPEHAHDHCLLTAMRRVSARLIRNSVTIQALAAVEPGLQSAHEHRLAPVIALLDVAPKSSPPSV
jgi:ABC-type glutathione transport system ATPase component